MLHSCHGAHVQHCTVQSIFHEVFTHALVLHANFGLRQCSQGEETAFLEDGEVRAALQKCTASAEPSAGARVKADAVLKAALLTQLQPRGRPTKVR